MVGPRKRKAAEAVPPPDDQSEAEQQQVSKHPKKKAKPSKPSKAPKTTAKPIVPAPLVSQTRPKTKIAPTLSRFSAKEKEALAATDRVMYVTIPRSMKKRRGEAFIALRKHITETCTKNLTGIDTSANAFYTVHYDSTKRRDAAILKLRNTPFKLADVTMPVVCMPFGRIDRSTIWTVSCSVITLHSTIQDAILKKFSGVDFSSAFEIRRRTFNQYDIDIISIRFEEPPPWLGKMIAIGDFPRCNYASCMHALWAHRSIDYIDSLMWYNHFPQCDSRGGTQEIQWSGFQLRIRDSPQNF